jgi:hypothetical protein
MASADRRLIPGGKRPSAPGWRPMQGECPAEDEAGQREAPEGDHGMRLAGVVGPERIEPVLQVHEPAGVPDVEAHRDASCHVRPERRRVLVTGGELQAFQLALVESQGAI